VKLAVALLAILALLGAAGLSSLQDDDFCNAYPAGTTSAASETTLWPPGWRCVYDGPGARRAVVDAGSVPWFLIALGAELAVGAWALRRRSAPARLAAATTAALAAVGALGLVGGFGFAFTAGVVVGVPLAWLVDYAYARAEGGRRSRRRSLETALAAGLAVFAAAVLASLTPAVAAAIVTVAAVAVTAAMPAARLRRAP
jgi:hypothetical protein